MEEKRIVHKASVAKGKSHALELLGESIDETCACPIKKNGFGGTERHPH
jgi:hypothetical protein